MSSSVVMLSVVLAIQEGPDPEDVKAGWLGLTVWLALAAAVVVLAFSLVRHLKRVDFEETPDEPSGTSAPPDNDSPAKPS